VRRLPLDGERDRPDHPTLDDQPAVVARRFHHERPVGPPRLALDPRAAARAAQLLVPGDEDGRLREPVPARRPECPERGEQDNPTAFHVPRAGAVDASVLNAERVRRERPGGPDRIEMNERQEPPNPAARAPRDEMIPTRLLRDTLDREPERRERLTERMP